MTEADLQALIECVAAPAQVITTPQVVQRLSRDFYWYSPILKKLLDDKVAEAVVQPVATDQVVKVLACCHARRIPITARGAGTGNYGQSIPPKGGVVLDLAREAGWELSCYPSTVVKASVGGFLGGGSGGIGSIAHGGLRDF